MDSDEDYNPEEDEDIVQDDEVEDEALVDDLEEEVDDEAEYLTQQIGGYEGVSDEGMPPCDASATSVAARTKGQLPELHKGDGLRVPHIWQGLMMVERKTKRGHKICSTMQWTLSSCSREWEGNKREMVLLSSHMRS